jgi:hypothetical protein
MDAKPETASIGQRIAKWYEGRWVAYENPPGSDIVIIGGNYERHWTSRTAHVLVDFYLAHWQWVIGTVLAIAGLLVALAALK